MLILTNGHRTQHTSVANDLVAVALIQHWRFMGQRTNLHQVVATHESLGATFKTLQAWVSCHFGQYKKGLPTVLSWAYGESLAVCRYMQIVFYVLCIFTHVYQCNCSDRVLGSEYCKTIRSKTVLFLSTSCTDTERCSCCAKMLNTLLLLYRHGVIQLSS